MEAGCYVVEFGFDFNEKLTCSTSKNFTCPINQGTAELIQQSLPIVKKANT